MESRCIRRYETFRKALANLKEAVNLAPPYSVVVQTGILGIFNICFEQAWKLMKIMLESHGVFAQKVGSPKVILKTAFEYGMIQNQEVWLEILASRNRLAHTYDEAAAVRIIEAVKDRYVPAFKALKRAVETDWL